MSKIPLEIKQIILEQKLQLWHNTLYDRQLDVKIAEAIGDERMKAQAVESMKSAMKAIDMLEGLLNESTGTTYTQAG